MSQGYDNDSYNLLILGGTTWPFDHLPRFRFLLNGHHLLGRKKTPKQYDSQDQQSHGGKENGHSDYKQDYALHNGVQGVSSSGTCAIGPF